MYMINHGNRVILRLVVLKLDVQAVFDSHFHLDRRVEFWEHTERVHNNVHFFTDVVQSPAYSYPQKVAAI